jgi:MFS transporter, FSR family, fosmidomycin resistance protein
VLFNRIIKGLKPSATASSVTLLTCIFLAIEFLDEFVDGVQGAAMPLIRDDLQLSYVQVGMLLAIPNIISNFIEPIFGILGDVGHRRKLILGGGIAFALALWLIALSQNFPVLLVAFILFYPASGAFVSLSQASLMDIDSTRHEQNMARWALAGSVGNVVGPLALGAAIALHQGWRSLYLVLAALTLLMLGVVWRFPLVKFATSFEVEEHNFNVGFKQGIRNALLALRRFEVLRWLTLLEFSNLMLDMLRGFLALYFVDVVGVNQTQASFAVTVWLGVGLLGDVLLIPLLERVRGLDYLRVSTLIVLCLYPAFLVMPNFEAKLVILGLLGFFNAGWYSILQGQLYSTMPGLSGTVMAVGNLFGLVSGLIPLGLGLVAQQYGLQITMWLLLLGAIALLIGIPKAR